MRIWMQSIRACLRREYHKSKVFVRSVYMACQLCLCESSEVLTLAQLSSVITSKGGMMPSTFLNR